MHDIAFSPSSALSGLPAFSEDDVLRGTQADPNHRGAPGWVSVEVDGVPDDLRIYGQDIRESRLSPLVFLEGDCSRRDGDVWTVFREYSGTTPFDLQLRAEQLALAMGRPFVNLARPGVYGSTGNHQQRRRPREVAVVDAALTALKLRFGWGQLDLAGFSGGGHLVAALMARRGDIGCAVIASGNVAVRLRNLELGRDADITGYTDFVDPIDLVAEVARHPPEQVIALTDPLDMVVSAAVQTAYVEALRAAGVVVDHRLVPAQDPGHHFLGNAALFAAAGARAAARPAP